MVRGRQSKVAWLAAIFSLAALGGCARYDNPYFVHSVWRPVDAASRQADVFFLTDRKPNRYWLPDKFDRTRGGVSCGVVHAEIPPARLPGSPAHFAHETGRDPLSCGEAGHALAAHIASTVQARHCDRVLVYVHGFNTGFETAVLRAAQLGNDTQWPCAVVAFSWASAGDRTQYTADRVNAVAAEPLFSEFLRALNAEHLKTSIVAHSMGTQIVLETLASGGEGIVADEVIFAAPDVGTTDFSALARAIRPRLRHLTIYTSSEDVALAVSPRLNSGAPRLGRDANGVRDLRSIDVIDATDAPAGLLGHGYYGLSYEMLADMSLALAGETAEERVAPRGSQPPTLERESNGSYRLAVDWKRAPDFVTRILRWLAASIAG